MNKIEISNPKISLINYIGIPLNYPSNTCYKFQNYMQIYTYPNNPA